MSQVSMFFMGFQTFVHNDEETRADRLKDNYKDQDNDIIKDSNKDNPRDL